MSTIAFGAGGSATKSIDDVVNTTTYAQHNVTIENNEVVTINHFTDTEKLREVRVLHAATGADAAVAAGGIASIVKTDADTTTITFGASAAGNFIIIVKTI